MPTLFVKQAPEESATNTSVQKQTPMNIFTAFARSPKHLRFETQEKDEVVILFLRQHLITLIPWFIVGAVMVLVPTILFPLIIKLISTALAVPVGYIIVGTVFWYVATFGFMMSKFLYWFFNIFIVTNERIVDIDFVNLLYKDIAETQLERVQDISYQTRGVLATMFNYGNVMIQTAGEVPNFAFERVPRPNEVTDIISDTAKLINKKAV
ncbi:MAG: PH domain-containing protein [Candidatus Gottesmanbacteria bacterium]